MRQQLHELKRNRSLDKVVTAYSDLRGGHQDRKNRSDPIKFHSIKLIPITTSGQLQSIGKRDRTYKVACKVLRKDDITDVNAG